MIELKITNNKDLYKEIARTLCGYKETPAGSNIFIVEGTIKEPKIGIRYPGKKVFKRDVKHPRSNSILWGNLYDFEVVPFKNGKEIATTNFTFSAILEDFDNHKKDNEKFWGILEELYQTNTLYKEPPVLPGIDSKLFLLVLKWIWIQEDFNYKLSWQDVNSPERYGLYTRTGTSTRKGAGRAKFFAALILVKHHFTIEEVKKIIPLY